MTQSLPGPAAAYAERFGWDIDLLSVSGSADTSPAAFLASRTPWIYLFGSDGVLRFHAHGAELERLERAVTDIGSESGRPVGRRR